MAKRTRAPGGGRKPLDSSEPTKKVAITLLASQVEAMEKLGNGNLSAGIRKAIDTMSIKVASEIITTDDAERISPTDQRIEARKATEPWQHGEWFANEDDQWQHKGHYLWLPDSRRIGVCTNGDSQWADADNVQHGLDMYVNDPDAYEAAN